MSSMELIVLFLAPTLLLGLVMLLPRLRKMLETRVQLAHLRNFRIQQFQEVATRLLNETDPERHEQIRNTILGAADRMMRGSALIRSLVFFARRKLPPSERASRAKEELESLSDELKHDFAKLLALALIVSSTNSWIFGRLYWSFVHLMVSESEPGLTTPIQVEVSSPVQVIEGFKRAGTFPSRREAA